MRLVFFTKAEQLGLFGPRRPLQAPRKPVQRPGIHGGHYRITETGEVRYDQPALPEPAMPPAAEMPPPVHAPVEPVAPAREAAQERRAFEDAIAARDEEMDALAERLGVTASVLWGAHSLATWKPAGPYARTPRFVHDALSAIKHKLGEGATDEQALAWARGIEFPPSPPPPDPQTHFDIPAENESALLARLAKLSQRAQRLKVPPPEVTKLGSFTRDILDVDGHPTGAKRTFYQYQITGDRPRIADWEFWASVQHERNAAGDGWQNILNTVPGVDERLPVSYRTSGPDCDHCHTERRRTDTYILRNIQTGEWKQVGRNCLKDFTGHANPEAIAGQAELLHDASEALSEYEHDSEGGGGRPFMAFDRDQLMTMAAALVMHEGYVSRAKADAQMRLSTADRILEWITPPKHERRQREIAEEKRTLLTPAAAELGAATKQWVVDEQFGYGDAAWDKMSEYEANLLTAMSREDVPIRNLALVASGVGAYMRAMGRKVEREKAAAVASQHVGKVGEKIDRSLTLVRVGEYEGNYGTVYPTTLADDEGNQFLWWASKKPDREDYDNPAQFEYQGRVWRPPPGYHAPYYPEGSPVLSPDSEAMPLDAVRALEHLGSGDLQALVERGEASVVPGTGPWRIGESRMMRGTIKKHDVDRKTNQPVTVLTRVAPPPPPKPKKGRGKIVKALLFLRSQLAFAKAAEQLGFDFTRKPVQKPGSRGSTKWYYDEAGQVQYGERPKPAVQFGPPLGFKEAQSWVERLPDEPARAYGMAVLVARNKGIGGAPLPDRPKGLRRAAAEEIVARIDQFQGRATPVRMDAAPVKLPSLNDLYQVMREVHGDPSAGRHLVEERFPGALDHHEGARRWEAAVSNWGPSYRRFEHAEHPVPREELQRAGYRAIGKKADLQSHGYQIVVWMTPNDQDPAKRNWVYEYVPRREGIARRTANADDTALIEEIEQSVGYRHQSAGAVIAPKLRALADQLQSKIDGLLNPGVSRQNVTARRARIAGGMFERGQALQGVQRALRWLADQHEAGTVPAEVAKLKTATAVGDVLHAHEIRLRLTAHARDLDEIAQEAETRGLTGSADLRTAAQRIRAAGDDTYGPITEPEARTAAAIVRAANAAPRLNKYGHKELLNDGLVEQLRDYDRLHAAGITTPAELRAARAILAPVAEGQPDPRATVRAMERAILGRQWAGYFPTPRAASEMAVAAADIKPGMRVLEPSAGKGDMAEAIRDACPECDITAVELVPELAAITRAKGFDVITGSIFDQDIGPFDRIVMNPPFEGGAEIDHVRHAYGLLKPGGRLVSIMSTGPFFRERRKDEEFREWLASVGGTRTEMPEGAFAHNVTSDRTTGVRTVLVTITKPEAPIGKAATCWHDRMLKAQLALFDDRRPHHPGSRGGQGYYDRWGHWQYGERPAGRLVDAQSYPPGVAPPTTEGAVPDLRQYDWLVVNSSAGKDSQAMLDYVVEQADAQRIPRERIVVVHADLGRMDWEGTAALALRQAAHYGLRFEVVRREKGDLLAQLRQERRKWPSSAARWCTSDQKTSQVKKLWTRLTREAEGHVTGRPVRILNMLGLRAEESPERAKKPEFKVRDQNSKRVVDEWLPIQHWTTADVWRRIKQSGVEHHGAYDRGFPRLSCVFCVFAPKAQLVAAGRENPELLREYVEAEREIGHRFRQDVSMADVAREVGMDIVAKARRLMDGTEKPRTKRDVILDLASQKAAIEKDLFYLEEEDLPALSKDDPRQPEILKARGAMIGELRAINHELRGLLAPEPARTPGETALLKAVRKLHGRRRVDGLHVSIENRRGSVRHWHDPATGEAGRTKMEHPYGYVRGTLGLDDDHLDVMLGPLAETGKVEGTTVYVITTKRGPEFVDDDEQKAMVGFASPDAAREAFLRHYTDPRFLGRMEALPWAEFKEEARATTDSEWRRRIRGDVVKAAPPMQPGPQTAEAPQPLRAEDIDHKQLGAHVGSYVPILTAALEQVGQAFPGVSVAGCLQETAGLAQKLAGPEPAEDGGIASLRLTVDSTAAQQAAASRLKRLFPVTGEEDYVARPRGGYRAIHLTVTVQGRPVEVQVRTARQTRWADAAHDMAYKAHGQPVPELRQYLAAVSETYACLDGGDAGGCPPMPECPPAVAALGCDLTE